MDNFIMNCIQKAQQEAHDESLPSIINELAHNPDIHEEATNHVAHNEDTDQNSVSKLYWESESNSENSELSEISSIETNNEDSLSLASPLDENMLDVRSTSQDEEESRTETSLSSRRSTFTCDTTNTNTNDFLPKSFLQLQGISIGNFNMACNYHISLAVKIMTQCKLHILAVQEHTAWNRELTEGEKKSMSRYCNKYGSFITISKLQIVIIDKQLWACHRETSIMEEGCIISTTFEISAPQQATFVSVYGVPHHGGEQLTFTNKDTEENSILQKMRSVQTNLKKCIHTAKQNNSLIFVFGDLQDAPDNSKTFHYGSYRAPKHPLGIVQTCENHHMSCTIYQHLDTLDKPVISRHGSKGGRFIDGMYACTRGKEKVTGISLAPDIGISSDHVLVISKIDLGIEAFEVCKDKEERFDYKKIMNIPVHIKPNDTHSTLNDTVYKGSDFRIHAQIYHDLQQIAEDPNNEHKTKIASIRNQLEQLQQEVINRTRTNISEDDQAMGKLIERTPEDARIINDASEAFFTLIQNICRQAGLAKKTYIIPLVRIKSKQDDIEKENIMVSTSSIAMSKQLEEFLYRTKNLCQQIGSLKRSILQTQRRNRETKADTKKLKLQSHIKRIKRHRNKIENQDTALNTSLADVVKIWIEIEEERENHILAIETSRNKQIYDDGNKYIDHVIFKQGKEEYEEVIDHLKEEILGDSYTKNRN